MNKRWLWKRVDIKGDLLAFVGLSVNTGSKVIVGVEGKWRSFDRICHINYSFETRIDTYTVLLSSLHVLTDFSSLYFECLMAFICVFVLQCLL